MRNVNSDKCLEVAGASTADQANVQQFTCHTGSNQLWRTTGYWQFAP
ncbi:MAG TPA: RICIN domain-containing protein [Terriglobia bacterium]|nr:RICIN domain-containing protein [Terriglobia bacterium]